MKPDALTPRRKRVAQPHRPLAPAARTSTPPGSWIIETGGAGGGGGGGGGDGTPGTTVTAVVGQDIGPRYTDKLMGQHTIVKLTATRADSSVDVNVTFWLQFGDGVWVRQGVWLVTTAHPFVTLGQKVIGTQGSPGSGNIWVPTDPAKRTWWVAAIEGNVASQDPPAAAKTASFDVPPVGAVLPTSCKNIHFVGNPADGDPIVYALDSVGVWTWKYYELDWDQPTEEEDGNYWFSFFSVQKGYEDTGGVWHPAPDNEGIDEKPGLYPGRHSAGSGDQGGGNPVLGSTVQLMGNTADWTYPPLKNPDGSTNLYRSFRFWVVGVSRLGTDQHGGDGVCTVQTGWPGGADHFDLTISTQPHQVDLSQANPITSFDPNGPLFGGGGLPLNIGVDDPLTIAENQITVADAKITEQYLADGAVTAQKTDLAAIDHTYGTLVANSVIDGLVTLPVSQLVYGSAIFTGNVYLSRGSANPVIALANDGIFLYGVASGTGATGGLTSQPYVAVQNTAIGVFASSGGPSVVTTAAGVTIYTVNGNLSQPYTAIAPAALTMKNGNFRLDVTSSQITLDSGSNYFVKLSSAMLRLVNSPFALVASATSIKLWASWNDSSLTGSTAAPVLTLDSSMLRIINLPFALIAKANALQMWTAWNETTLAGDTSKPYLGLDSTGLYMAGGGSSGSTLSLTANSITMQATGSTPAFTLGSSGGASFSGFITCGAISASGTVTCPQLQTTVSPPFLLSTTTYGAAGSLAGYFAVTINGTNYRIAYYNP